MTLKIISAQQIEFEGPVKSVILPGTLGQFMVLENHAALIASLDAGVISYDDANGTRHTCEIRGGVADVNNNVVSVCLY